MTYLPDMHTYLHQSSLLIQAYPTTRITTKYSLPRKSTKKPSSTPTATDSALQAQIKEKEKEKREPSAVLTLKTFHPETGICLKYRTDKAQEVGRLMTSLGRLAKGEVIELPAATAAGAAPTGDQMDVDERVTSVVEETQATSLTQQQQSQQPQQTAGTSGTGGKKKKKGKK